MCKLFGIMQQSAVCKKYIFLAKHLFHCGSQPQDIAF